MPYIEKGRRDVLKSGMVVPRTAGELNFRFTQLAIDYLAVNGVNYQHFNDILGALEGCKLELYRRKIADYEDEKMVLNGDVYGG